MPRSDEDDDYRLAGWYRDWTYYRDWEKITNEENRVRQELAIAERKRHRMWSMIAVLLLTSIVVLAVVGSLIQ